MLNKLPKSRIMLTIAGAVASGIVSAASVQVSPTNPSMGIGGNSAASITFTGDAFVTNISGRINYDTALFDVTVNAGGTATCTNFDGTGRVTFVTTSGTGLPIPSQTLCNLTFTHAGAAAVVSPYTFSNTVFAGTGSADTSPGGNLTVTLGPAVGPTITYTPATGGTVTFPAATSIGGSTAQAITLVGAGGQNSGTTVLSACSSTVGNITFTDGADTCTAGGACVDASLSLACVSTNAAQTGTATCTETRQNETVSGDGITAVNPRTWNVSCPAANVAPALAYNPVPGPITMPTVGQGQTANSSIVVTPSAGSGTGSSTVSGCAFSGAVGATFTAPVGTLTFNGSGTTAQNLNFSCVAPTNGQPDGTATLTCSENIGGTITARVWTPVTCPDGLPVAAPGVTYAPPAGPITFAAGASVGASVPGSTSVAVDISGGADNGTGAAEQTTVTCSATAGFTVSGSPIGPVLVGDSTNPNGTVSVSCTSAASAQAGTLTCNAAQSIDGTVTTNPTTFALDCAAAEVNITSAPPAGPISLAGAPLTNVAGSIVLSNSGSDSTLGCSASGAVTLGVVPGTVPSAGSATVPYTCLTGAAGVAGTGQIVCLTQDPGAEATLTYDISCVGLSDVPVPAINNFGKLLMVVLVIGLGLVGLGARRQ